MPVRNINTFDQDEDRFLGSGRGIQGSFDLGFKGGRIGGGQLQSGQGNLDQQDVPLRSQWQQGGQQSNWGQQDLQLNRQFQRGGLQSNLGQQQQQDWIPLRNQWQQGGQFIDQDIPVQQQQWRQQGVQPCGVQCDYFQGGQGRQQGQQQQGGLNRNWNQQDLPINRQWQNQSGLNNWNNQDIPIQGQLQNQQRGPINWEQQQQKDWGHQQGGNQQLIGRGQQQGQVGWAGEQWGNQERRSF